MWRVYLLILVVWLFSACAGEPDEWEGFVYPDVSDMSEYESIGPFSSLEECRGAALYRLRLSRSPDKGDYECGLNCRIDRDVFIRVCETTSQ
jgi:hypothetical protein